MSRSNATRNRKTTALRSQGLPLTDSIGYLLRHADRAVEDYLHSRLATYDIPIGMWFYLRVLWIEDGLTQAELAKHVGATAATTALQLARMEHRGLIRRETGAKDRRRSHVYLTEAGRSLEEPLVKEAANAIDRAQSGFSAADVQKLKQMLRQVIANLPR